MIDRRLEHRCLRMAYTVAPELLARHLYIVDAAEVTFAPESTATAAGWASQYASVAFADVLGVRFRGDGAVIVLNLDLIERCAQPGRFERLLLSVLAHETAHLVPAVEGRRLPRADPMLVELAQALYSQAVVQRESDDYDGVSDDAHDWRFARRVLHCWFRATLNGFELSLPKLFDRKPSPSERLPGLLAECVRMVDADFATIEATDPPDEFLTAFERNQINAGRTT